MTVVVSAKVMAMVRTHDDDTGDGEGECVGDDFLNIFGVLGGSSFLSEACFR